MCDNILKSTERGASCEACGNDNSRLAHFCAACGAVLSAEAVAVPAMAELAARVNEAAGGVGVGAADDGYEDEGDFMGDAEEEEEGTFGEALADVEVGDDFGPTTQAAAQTLSKEVPEEVADEDVPGPILDESAGEITPDEDFAPPPPPGMVSAEEEMAPPPPPDELEVDEDDFAPPPPPGMVTQDSEPEAPPPPPADLDFDEDDFAPPPPPPPGLADEDEELPPPPPPAVALDEGEESEDVSGDDNSFGAWELEFTEDEEEEEKPE